MKTTFKKISAAVLAAAAAITLSGCTENGYIMTVDGMDIRTGVYLSLQQTSINLANQKVEELKSADGADETSSDTSASSDTASSDEEVDVFEYTIDGKTYSDWIINDTREGVLRFVGIQRECERLGITLTEEEKNEIINSVNEQWEDTTIAYYGLDFANWGEYYESMGMGIESMKELSIVDSLNEKLFLSYYGEGGQWAVTDEEFSTKANELYAAYNLIALQYTDYTGTPLLTDAEKQEINDTVNNYAERFNNDDSLIDIMYDYSLRLAQDKARAEAEKEYSEEKAEGLTKEEYIQKAVDDVDVAAAEDESEFDEVIEKASSPLTEELTDFIFSLPLDGKAYVYEGTSSAYMVVRKSVLDLEGWEDYYRSDILREMKGEEFDSKMDLICQNYDVVQKDYLVNTKYSPKKIINK